MLKEIEYFSSEVLTITISDFIIISINTISIRNVFSLKINSQVSTIKHSIKLPNGRVENKIVYRSLQKEQ